jgi:hypothetical protein
MAGMGIPMAADTYEAGLPVNYLAVSFLDCSGQDCRAGRWPTGLLMVSPETGLVRLVRLARAPLIDRSIFPHLLYSK